MNLSEGLRAAIRDYRYLLDAGYPESPSRDLVSNRFRLSRSERSILYRGVFPTADGQRRARRLVTADVPNGTHVRIDGLNVLYTLVSYLLGQPVFLATDGWLRDTSESHGREVPGDAVKKAAGLCADCRVAAGAGPGQTTWLLDEKADATDQISDELRALQLDCRVLSEVDAELVSADSGLIATSDSQIIDRCRCGVLDLPRRILDQSYSPTFVHLGMLL